MKLAKITALTVLTVAGLLLFTGCGRKNEENVSQANPSQTPQNQTPQSQTPQTQTPADTNSSTASMANEPTPTNAFSNQMVASEYYLSLGTLDKGVVVEGNNRDRDEVEILNGKLVFPLGTIRGVIVKEKDKEERFVNANENEVRQLLTAAESAACLTAVTANPDNKWEIILVYQTYDNEYRTIHIESAGKDSYLLRVKEDDRDEFAEIEDITDKQTGNEYKVVQIQSKEVSKIVKKWIKK